MAETAQHKAGAAHGETIHLPAPTAWPIVLAFGCTMAAGGLVTSLWVTAFGAVLMVAGCVGWFRQVLPHEEHEEVPVIAQAVTITTTRHVVRRLQIGPEHRAHLPVETYPITSGIKGGIAGGIAMIFPALAYGLIAQHSIWYPVNLLGGAGVGPSAHITTAEIATFHWSWLVVAIVIHSVTCLLVGLLYGAMLPMLPQRPVLLGGILAPLLWTGLLHSTMGIINPALDARIQWGWFVVSQVTFGVVAGLVVAREGKIRTSRGLPFFARMGIEAPGLMESHPDAGPARSTTRRSTDAARRAGVRASAGISRWRDAGDCRGQRRRRILRRGPKMFWIFTRCTTRIARRVTGPTGTMGRRWSSAIPNIRRWWMTRRCGSGFREECRERRCRRLRSRREGC